MTMRQLLLLAAILSLALVVSAKPSLNEWNEFKKQHGKEYADQEEDNMRMSIFLNNKKMVEEFNRDESHKRGFKMGINHLSDWTEAELDGINGFKLPGKFQPRNSLDTQEYLESFLNKDRDNTPAQKDWRDTPGVVSSVKNQGKCGSCWAFSAVGTLEGQEISHNKPSLIDLSPQNLVDCDKMYSKGCEGGSPYYALEYIGQVGGIMADKTYPYTATDGSCRFKENGTVFTDAGGMLLPPYDEDILKNSVANFGPVSVAINVDGKDFFHYSSGIYNSKTCKNDLNSLNHGVLVVGYGNDAKEGDYWIVKNSWSEKWGDKGYIKMARNKNNMCGIVSMPLIPRF